MSILIKNIQHNQQQVDIFIEGKIIKKIGESLSENADKIIDGSGKAVIPGFVNGHTHSAMTLFRGVGDDMTLEQWLYDKIWPYESKLTNDDVYWGVKLACLEMIKSGTTCFNDMYAFFPDTLRAVEEMGMRAVLGGTIFDFFDEEKATKAKQEVENWLSLNHSDRITFTVTPHAIYTVSAATLQWANDLAKANNLFLHTHLAETKVEYDNSVKEFGLSPVRYLNKLKLLSPQLIIAHCLWLDEEEIAMLAEHDVKVIHNPNSNLKLASGFQFKYEEMKKAGITVGIGTDGCASSNNLDLLEAAKIASFMQKAWRKDSTIMPAQEIFDCMTKNGAKILQINAGKIEIGCLADLCLVDLKIPAFSPNFHFISNLIYAANGNCVDTVICDGKILMENKHVSGEEEIMERAAMAAKRIVKE